MIGRDIVAISVPDRLAARLIEKARPQHDVVAVGAQRVSRARAIGGKIAEEAVELDIVKRAVPKDDRHIPVAARPRLLQRDHWRTEVICEPSPRPPPGA